jgi:hypothetical protein
MVKIQSAKRKGLDFENLNIIPASEIPPKSKVHTPYQELLRQIGKGQALILSENEVSIATASAAVRRMRKQNEFKKFTVTQRTINGEKKLFIINNEKE